MLFCNAGFCCTSDDLSTIISYRLLSHLDEEDEGSVASGSSLTSARQTPDQMVDQTQLQQPKSLKCEEWVSMVHVYGVYMLLIICPNDTWTDVESYLRVDGMLRWVDPSVSLGY